jgi:putative two-component system response regulator
MGKLLSRYVSSKILLIDDDTTNNLLVESILHNHGFRQIKSIADSRLAADTFLEYDPELILLDLEMPYINGFEVYRKIQKLSKNNILPVIIVTVNNDHKNKTRAMELGVQYFLEKPVDKTELLVRAQNILNINWLYEQTARKNKLAEEKIKLENSVVETLCLSMKFRDQETGDHINRVNALVYILSKGIGLTDNRADKLAKASKLHDIGKIGIPDNVLCREGRLTDEELEIMKNHTLIGERILSVSSSNLLRLAGTIARVHHENWDGSGYPAGLAGKRIPLGGRLTALADVFDALLSDRPYKKAWDFERAIKYVQQESGKKFDPEMVDTLIKNIQKIRLIYSGTNNSDEVFQKTTH